MTRLALLVAGSYLLGAIPFSYLVVRFIAGLDVRHVGSGNVGATNAMRAAGKGVGALALACDIGKGVAAVLLARWLGASPTEVALAATAAVLGHVYPVFLGFRGGKGVATAAGALGALAPLPGLLAVVVFLAVVGWKRYVSLGSVVAAASFPAWLYLAGRLGWRPQPGSAFLLAATLVPLLIVWRHRGNIERLLAGTEHRLGDGRGVAGRGET